MWYTSPMNKYRKETDEERQAVIVSRKEHERQYNKQYNKSYYAQLKETSFEKIQTYRDRGQTKRYRTSRLWRERVKKEVIGHYGSVCKCCGESHLAFLTLDHKNGDGAEHRRQLKLIYKRDIGSRIYQWCRKNGYPDLFQVLCWNCNCGRRCNGGICPHAKQKL